VPFSAWLCLIALIMVLPFLLAGIDRLITNVVPVSLGLLLGLFGVMVGHRVYPLLISDQKRAGVRDLSLPLLPALSQALQKTGFDGALQGTGRAQAARDYQQQIGKWLAPLHRHIESARRPLTGALWLSIAGGLMGAFVVAT
jgi:hypothetical protein